jgi:hypothetical protein
MVCRATSCPDGVVAPSLPELARLASARTTEHISRHMCICTEPSVPHFNSRRHTQDKMAPRKKTEEKASANEATDMVMHYLRKSLAVHIPLQQAYAQILSIDFIQASRTVRTQRSMCPQICIIRLLKVCTE